LPKDTNLKISWIRNMDEMSIPYNELTEK